MQEVSLSIDRKVESVNSQVKSEISKLVRKEHKGMFEGIPPESYYILIKHAWYDMFDKSKSIEERMEYRNVIRNIFEIYSNNDPEIVLRGMKPLCSVDSLVRETQMMLSKVKDGQRLLVPVMTGGFLFGAFVYGHLRERNTTPDLAFIGHKRDRKYVLPGDEPPDYYEKGRIHIMDRDAEILRKHEGESALIIDDIFETGKTAHAITAELEILGIRGPETLVLENWGVRRK